MDNLRIHMKWILKKVCEKWVCKDNKDTRKRINESKRERGGVVEYVLEWGLIINYG